MSITFAYPWVLALLALVPVLAAYRFLPRFRKRHESTFLFSRVALLSRQKGLKHYLRPVPSLLALIALGLVIVALARPQSVTAEEIEVEGIDIYLVLDMSGSMQAIDMSEQELRHHKRMNEKPKNRFETAIDTLKDFVESREYDRIGMVVFAKEAFLQFPLTLDYNTILNMLDRLSLGDIDKSGTAIGNALGRAVAGLEDSEATSKIVILITDGDRRGGNISPKQAADIASDQDIHVYPILVGRDGPTLVPTRVRSFFGNEVRYQKTEFPVNPELLEEIARKTDGEFYRAEDEKALRDRIHKILDDYERTRIKDATNVEKEELFTPFVLWAAVLFAAQFILRKTYLRSFP